MIDTDSIPANLISVYSPSTFKSGKSEFSDRIQCLIQIFEKVVHVFDAD